MLAPRLFYSPADGGTAPAGAVVPPAPSGAAPAAPPPAPPAAPPSDEPPAWAKALMAKVDALEGQKKKLEADKGAAEEKAQTVEQQLAAQRKAFEEFQTQAQTDKIDGAIGRISAGYQFSTTTHGEAGIALFRSTHRLEVKDGAVLATGSDGKPQHLANAFAAWAKSPAGALFVSSTVQPGPGTPPAGTPQGTTQKRLREMSDAEFAEWRRTATVSGSLTPGGEKLTIKPAYDPMRERREAILGRMGGANHGTIHK